MRAGPWLRISPDRLHTRTALTPMLRPAAILALLLGTCPLVAQEAADPERWNVELGLALNSTGGNQRLTVLTTNLGVTHLQTDIFEMGLNGRFRYGRSEGVDVAQNLRGVLNFDLYPQDRWSPFLFVTAEQDPFRKLEVRLNGGAGAKHTFWRNDWQEASLSGAVLYSMENLEVADSLGDGISEDARFSWRGRFRKQVGERNRLEQVVFYQPVYDEFDDYLLESATSLRVGLTERIGMTASYVFERDSTPPAEVRRDDWSLAVGLSLATRW